eukprot:TRINITY_DN114753_c0_g1_i1.p1 TRINITY_DN114753_c0_g1~~TRINITY_DN114753_c0_g1_i1.p1  ORF type:complete len:349 (-),score=13.22 TRINITY_DN114753_c0_g1_i1:1136-2182(-)
MSCSATMTPAPAPFTATPLLNPAVSVPKKAVPAAGDSGEYGMPPFLLEVVDPCIKTGKIQVPSELVADTMGRRQYVAQRLGGKKPVGPGSKRTIPDYSLCLLFQKGACSAGPRCRQIHADTNFVGRVREKILAGSTCCGRHGDPRSTDPQLFPKVACAFDRHSTFLLCKSKTEQHCISTCAVARTVGLERLQTGTVVKNELVIDWTSICRLHQKEKCKFGCDCKNIHLCREVYANFQQLETVPQVFNFNFTKKPNATAPVSPAAPSVGTNRRRKSNESSEAEIITNPVYEFGRKMSSDTMSSFKGSECDLKLGGSNSSSECGEDAFSPSSSLNSDCSLLSHCVELCAQ